MTPNPTPAPSEVLDDAAQQCALKWRFTKIKEIGYQPYALAHETIQDLTRRLSIAFKEGAEWQRQNHRSPSVGEVLESALKDITGKLFVLSQPNNGDLFWEMDDYIRAIIQKAKEGYGV